MTFYSFNSRIIINNLNRKNKNMTIFNSLIVLIVLIIIIIKYPQSVKEILLFQTFDKGFGWLSFLLWGYIVWGILNLFF